MNHDNKFFFQCFLLPLNQKVLIPSSTSLKGLMSFQRKRKRKIQSYKQNLINKAEKLSHFYKKIRRVK